jgi:pimeloyl-ACP methyl ester carboxylesterase
MTFNRTTLMGRRRFLTMAGATATSTLLAAYVGNSHPPRVSANGDEYSISGSTTMKMLQRDGVTLACDDAGSATGATPPLVFVHGWCCDHTFLASQVEHFSASHRVLAVDLRGHGASDAPQQNYTVRGFADDVAWQCAQLGIEKPVIIGHSMGEQIALDLAARYPDLPAAIMLLDSVILPSPAFVDMLRPLAEALRGPDYRTAIQQGGASLFLPTDDAARKARLLDRMAMTPQHVAASAFVNHLIDYDATGAGMGCTVPAAYISAAVTMADLTRFRAACPQLVTAQTLGSGHFAALEVPDQVNAMIERFLAVGIA